jgi:hypothetical protein
VSDNPTPPAIGWTRDDAVMAALRAWLVERGFVVVRDHLTFDSFGDQEVLLTRPIAIRLVRDRGEWLVDVLGRDGQWEDIQGLRRRLRGRGPQLLTAADQADSLRELLDEAEEKLAD